MSLDRRVMAIAVLASLFVSGVAVGAVGMLYLNRPTTPEPRFTPGEPPAMRGGGLPDGPPMVAQEVVRRLADELELDAAQRDSLAAILARQRAVARRELAAVAPRLRASLDSAAILIRDILTPDQQTRFDELEGILAPPVSRPGFRGPPGEGTGGGGPGLRRPDVGGPGVDGPGGRPGVRGPGRGPG